VLFSGDQSSGAMPMNTLLKVAFAMLAMAALAGTSAAAQQAAQTTPPVSAQAEKHLHNYGELDATCVRWTDRCRTCTRGISETPICSNIGVACQPREVECMERLDKTDK